CHAAPPRHRRTPRWRRRQPSTAPPSAAMRCLASPVSTVPWPVLPRSCWPMRSRLGTRCDTAPSLMRLEGRSPQKAHHC
ncbi:MAG: hypothetical protein AVDCRST_MAG27-3413, partial [uncultured Craurococcus sp.]